MPRWWLLSALGAMVVMQCHVLGVVVVPPLLVAWLVDVRGRRRRASALRPAFGAGVGDARDPREPAYLPLLAFELQHDFAETRAILAYLGGKRQQRRVWRPCPDRDRRRPGRSPGRSRGCSPIARCSRPWR